MTGKDTAYLASSGGDLGGQKDMVSEMLKLQKEKRVLENRIIQLERNTRSNFFKAREGSAGINMMPAAGALNRTNLSFTKARATKEEEVDDEFEPVRCVLSAVQAPPPFKK